VWRRPDLKFSTLHHVCGADVCTTNAARKLSAPVLGPPRVNHSRCLLFRKAPRRRRQRRGHTLVGGSATITSQGPCNTLVVLHSITNAGVPGVSVGRLPPRVNLLCPLLKKAPRPDHRRPGGGGGGSSNSHSQHPPRGGGGPTTISRLPDTCVVLMQINNAGALGVGAGTRLPPRAADGGGGKRYRPLCVVAPLTCTWGGCGGTRACKCPPTVRGHWSDG
jgi:hypothetical protein